MYRMASSNGILLSSSSLVSSIVDAGIGKVDVGKVDVGKVDVGKVDDGGNAADSNSDSMMINRAQNWNKWDMICPYPNDHFPCCYLKKHAADDRCAIPSPCRTKISTPEIFNSTSPFVRHLYPLWAAYFGWYSKPSQFPVHLVVISAPWTSIARRLGAFSVI